MWKLCLTLILALCFLAACKPSAEDSAASAAGLKPGQYSPTAKGSNAIVDSAGRTTEVLTSGDLSQLGVEPVPGSKLADGAIYRHTTPNEVMTTANLVTSKPAKEVTAHFEKQLGKPASRSALGVIVTGKTKDGGTCVVTILDKGTEGTEILVQTYQKAD